MLASSPDDSPRGIQLLGSKEEQIPAALDALEAYRFDLLDFNAACPAPKVARKGKGAALLKEPRRLKELLTMLVRYSGVPVTVKIRAGWDEDSVNAREIALMAEDSGVSALFIHGRTMTQGYGGAVDYGIIRAVKEALRIPVIASGDNLSVPLIKKMFDRTGCDGVAIARGSMGNPWIFRDIMGFLDHGRLPESPSLEERLAVLRDHMDLTLHQYGERRGVGIFHKFFIWYTRGLRNTRPIRDKAFRADTKDELLALIEDIRLMD